MTIDDVLAFVEKADASAVKRLSQAIAIRQAKLASGKTTTASVYREVEGHPTNPPKRPAGGERRE